ncbi:ankyrin repeat-containing domain protein [Trichoderma camerunense]
MNDDAGHRMGTTRAPAHSANISGSSFGDNIRIQQAFLNIFFRNRRNPTVSPESTPSPAVQAQLEEKEKTDCRRSLGFRDLDARLQNISPVQQGTCEWIFQMPVFQNWHEHTERDNGLLWIKGNPGTGKSTLMKHILQHCQTKGKYAIATYFFNARGAHLEQTPLGMLRSLLFQLLEHEPSYYNGLLSIFRKKQQDHSLGDWEWREPELKNFLLSEIPKCQSRPLLLIIDALDECSNRDVQNVADFLRDLSDNATDAGLTLNICLSSRHFPSIRCAKYQELVLENEKKHNEDIIKYISSNLTKKDEEIEEAIRKKSSGIFMWVVLVIRLLNKAYEDGRVEAMKDVLDEMPNELEEMFAMLLDRDNPDKDETILILQCVLFAKRRLTPEEIYFAIIAGTNSQALGIWNPWQITPDIIRRRIISSSRGLIEICKSEPEFNQFTPHNGIRSQRIRLRRLYKGFAEKHGGKRETVQFIHGSVNDFLLRNSRLQRLDPGLIPDPIAKGHDRLKGCCMTYVMMDPLELQNIQGIESKFPFLEYASHYLFDHAEEATSEGQTELLRTLKDDTALKRVERFHHYFVYYDQTSEPLNLLQILAAGGLSKLVVGLLDGEADINAEGVHVPYGTALETAIEFENEETVKTLLSKGAKIDSRGSLYGRTTLYKAFKKGNRGILAVLIDRGATLGILERIVDGDVLHQAAKSGDADIIGMVLHKGAKVNVRALRGSPLCVATVNGQINIVKMLLEKGANVDVRGLPGTPLCLAAFNNHQDLVEILLENGANIHREGLFGSPLAIAASRGHMSIVEKFLEKGANIHTRGLFGSPLAFAASGGKIEIVKKFLEKGANIHMRGLFGSPLHFAASGGHIDIVKFFLEKGANIHARGLLGNPLQTAAAVIDKDQAEIIETLVHKGAGINAWGGLFGPALHAAVMKGHRNIVRTLLENGANVNARGFTGLAYLWHKPFNKREDKREEIPKILLEEGFKVRLWGKIYGTALQAAVAIGQGEEMIQLLLDNGAKI